MINRYVAKNKTAHKKKVFKKGRTRTFGFQLQPPAPWMESWTSFQHPGFVKTEWGRTHSAAFWFITVVREKPVGCQWTQSSEYRRPGQRLHWICLWMSTRVRADRRPENKRRAETQPLSGSRPAHCTEGSGCNYSHALSCPRSPPVRMLRTSTKFAANTKLGLLADFKETGNHIWRIRYLKTRQQNKTQLGKTTHQYTIREVFSITDKRKGLKSHDFKEQIVHLFCYYSLGKNVIDHKVPNVSRDWVLIG